MVFFFLLYFLSNQTEDNLAVDWVFRKCATCIEKQAVGPHKRVAELGPDPGQSLHLVSCHLRLQQSCHSSVRFSSSDFPFLVPAFLLLFLILPISGTWVIPIFLGLWGLSSASFSICSTCKNTKIEKSFPFFKTSLLQKTPTLKFSMPFFCSFLRNQTNPNLFISTLDERDGLSF